MSSAEQITSTVASQTQQSHFAQLYGADERVLAINVGKYLFEGLQRREAVLVIATQQHTAAFVRQLQRLGADPNRAIKEERLLLLDAETTLGTIMTGGQPDPTLFRRMIAGALDTLRGAAEGAGKRAYGELVGVLWQRGEYSAAIRLEELWNELLAPAGLQLFCGYPIDIFASEFHSHNVEQVLQNHTHLLPTGEDADLERAVHQALEDFAFTAGTPVVDAPSCANSIVLPKPEKAILALRIDAPEQAHEILTHARRYYEGEKRFRILIENSSDAILLMSPQRDILYASSSTRRVLGYAPQEITGRDCLDLLHPADREHGSRSIARALANPHSPVQFEARALSRNGACTSVEITVTDLSDEPAVGGMVWNYRDISERKRAEQALRDGERRLAAREAYLQTLLDSMPECVKVVGRDGEVLEMNTAGLRMLEADSPDQVIGKCFYPLITEADRSAFQCLNESVFEGGPGGSLEFSILGFKGGHRIFETYAVPLRDASDHVIGALSVTRDITQRKAADIALRHANEGLEQFAYAAAHDLQEPIRNVVLYTELLEKRYRNKLDEDANEFMSITVASAQRMQTLIQDLLAYTRSLDRPSEEQPATDANEVVQEVLGNLRTAIDTAGAEIVCSSLPKLPIYRVHLVQLLQNLVGNALKYRSEGPARVEISAVETPAEFVVSVRDNGIGIPADHRERIFGVFKRLHGRNVPGNGIGLAICQRIISHYAGRIWVESQEGLGSTFIFTLPRKHLCQS